MHTATGPTQIHVLSGTLLSQLARVLTALGRPLKCFLLVSHMVVDSRKEPALHLSMHTQGVVLEMTVCNCLVSLA